MNNAIELISAYNTIDARLRTIYRGKGNLQFSDLVRRCAELNKTVQRYEEELMALARLRNAIVHNSTREQIIAQPSDEFTALTRHICELLSAPPKLKSVKEKGATGIAETATVEDAILLIARTGYSNLPVYRNGRLCGMLNNRRLVKSLGDALEYGESVSDFLGKQCSQILRDDDFPRYYRVLSMENTVQDAIDAFAENRKLLAVVVTEHGVMGERILNLLTASDLPVLFEMLEN